MVYKFARDHEISKKYLELKILDPNDFLITMADFQKDRSIHLNGNFLENYMNGKEGKPQDLDLFAFETDLNNHIYTAHKDCLERIKERMKSK